MAEVPGYPLSNLLLYALVAISPTVAFWVLLRLPGMYRRMADRWRSPAPAHRPIQAIAADLRRVRRSLTQFEAGTPAARREGARRAYDSLLIQACAALEVEHRLAVPAEGIERDLERLRVEESLRAAGLVIS